MLIRGDLFDVLPTLDAESIDACVTDPPYGISFMGKSWDNFQPEAGAKRVTKNKQIAGDNPNLKGRTRGPASSPSAVEYDRSLHGQRAFQDWTERWALEVYRVLKPGAHVLVCGAPRSFHRMTCGLEDAGFVVRDCFSWLYGQGFPKSLNIGKGQGTALKPGWEPIVLARKPFSGSVTANVERYGTGALNIDACRVGTGGQLQWVEPRDMGYHGGTNSDAEATENVLGRWPANVLLDEEAAALLDTKAPFTGAAGAKDNNGAKHWHRESVRDDNWGEPLDALSGASRFYYVAKPSREERDYGCSGLALSTKRILGSGITSADHPEVASGGGNRQARNVHPTVKPVELMRWLVKLVTPISGTVLDPFMGSGTTGMACRYEQREFIGVEREAEYVAIAERRIAAVAPLFAAVGERQASNAVAGE